MQTKKRAHLINNQFAAKSNDERKTKYITISCTTQDREKWNIKAREKGVSLNKLVRSLLDAC